MSQPMNKSMSVLPLAMAGALLAAGLPNIAHADHSQQEVDALWATYEQAETRADQAAAAEDAAYSAFAQAEADASACDWSSDPDPCDALDEAKARAYDAWFAAYGAAEAAATDADNAWFDWYAAF